MVRVSQLEVLEPRTLLAAPVTVNGSATPGANRAYEGSLLTFALDADNDKLTFASVGQPTHGSLSVNSQGTFVYTPTSNYVGPDAFTFKANDGTADSNIATFSLDVRPAVPPIATDAGATVSQDRSLSGSVASLATDANGDKLLFQAVSLPSHGTLSFSGSGAFVYTPNPGYVGADSFKFKANDGLADSNIATISLNVKVAVPPIAIDGSGSPVENVVFSGTVKDLALDADGDPLTFAAVSLPTHGTLNLLANGSFTYLPAANYIGTDSFSFKANDGAVDSNIATFRLTINASVAPVTTDGAAVANQNQVLNGSVASLATDVNNQALLITVVASTTHGKLIFNPSGSFSYTPDPDFVGEDSFQFKASDGLLTSNISTFRLNVRAVVPPVASAFSVNIDEDISFTGTLVPLASDPDGGKLTFRVVTPPQHGTLNLNTNGTFTYTPNLNYNGHEEFTFVANDGVSDSNVATFGIELTPVNDPLKFILNAAAAEVPRETGFVRLDSTASVLDVDTSVNYAGAKLRVSIVSGSSRGVLSVLAESPGPTAVTIKGTKLYYGTSADPVATMSGGRSGNALAINFSKSATFESVNAVLKQVAMRAGNDVVRGQRQLKYAITADRQSTTATKLLNIV